MTDCWEILGRLAGDAAFQKTVFSATFNPPYSIGANGRAAIPKKDYDSARTTLRNAGFTDRPISLMALGEILYALAFSSFRKAMAALALAIQNTRIKTVNRDFNFYVALGAMIVDDTLRGELLGVSPYTQFDTFGFKGVVQADRADLAKLGDPNKSPTVVAAADQLCTILWAPDCFEKYEFWNNHTHPVANP